MKATIASEKEKILEEFVDLFRVKSNEYILNGEWMMNPEMKWKYLYNFIEQKLDHIASVARQEETCTHKEPDVNCPCWLDGFQTADAEQCYEKIQAARQEGREEVVKEIKNTPLEFLEFHDMNDKDATFVKKSDLLSLLAKLTGKEEGKA